MTARDCDTRGYRRIACCAEPCSVTAGWGEVPSCSILERRLPRSRARPNVGGSAGGMASCVVCTLLHGSMSPCLGGRVLLSSSVNSGAMSVSHRAAIYSVRVYPARKRKPDLRPLGDYDESGTWLGDTFTDLLGSKFAVTNKDEDRTALCRSVAVDGHEVRMLCEHGMSGMVAQIIDQNGNEKTRQGPADTSLVRCGSLFRFDPNDEVGWWATHINHGRSAKSLIQKGLADRFRIKHEDLTLNFRACVDHRAYIDAVKRGRVESVKLTKLEAPSDHAIRATQKWVDPKKEAHLELRIKGAKADFINAALLRRFLSGDKNAEREIFEFEDIPFDRAKIEVALDEGKRSFDLERPDTGFAFSCELDDLDLVDGEPTEASLFAALGTVLDDHAG